MSLRETTLGHPTEATRADFPSKREEVHLSRGETLLGLLPVDDRPDVVEVGRLDVLLQKVKTGSV